MGAIDDPAGGETERTVRDGVMIDNDFDHVDWMRRRAPTFRERRALEELEQQRDSGALPQPQDSAKQTHSVSAKLESSKIKRAEAKPGTTQVTFQGEAKDAE
jgi:hypothetical protein